MNHISKSIKSSQMVGLAITVLMLASLVFAGPKEFLEAQKMTDLQEYKEVPEECQISMVVKMLNAKGKNIPVNNMYAGKIYADHIKWLEMGDLAIDVCYLSTDPDGLVWCTIFTPNLIFAYADMKDPEIRATTRFVMRTVTINTGAIMIMAIQ